MPWFSPQKGNGNFTLDRIRTPFHISGLNPAALYMKTQLCFELNAYFLQLFNIQRKMVLQVGPQVSL